MSQAQYLRPTSSVAKEDVCTVAAKDLTVADKDFVALGRNGAPCFSPIRMAQTRWATDRARLRYCPMPKRPHTELRCSKDGPWITLHGEQSSLTFNLRELVRGLMPAERYAHRRRVMAEWVKARDAEGKGEPVKVPPGKVGERLGPLRKPIPASRRIPPRTLKR